MPPGLPYVVIGSGPTGVACTQALLERGKEVLMLDAGAELEPARQEFVDSIAALPKEKWPAETVARLKERMAPTAAGVPLKYLFGSDFPYRRPAAAAILQSDGVGLQPSYATGGLSRVWGAAMLPYRTVDMESWPFGAEALAPHYRAVCELTGLAGESDDLEEYFPLFAASTVPLRRSRQMEALLADLRAARDALRRDGIIFGGSRLAVRARQREDQPGCEYCGMCMYGCPYGHIYDAASTVRQWADHPRFRHQRGVVVHRMVESGESVQVVAQRAEGGEPISIEARRVFLAAGVISTTQILLESLSAYDRPVTIRDSQYFLLPLLRWRRTTGLRAEPANTLSQIFVELLDTAPGSHNVHLQLYGWNDLLDEGMKTTLGPLALPALVRELGRRMIVVQGYLHSDHSPGIEMRVSSADAASAAVVHLRPLPNPATRRHIRRITRKLLAQSLRLKAFPLLPMLHVAKPGRGFHSGGTFPMRKNPAAFESDLLGRPHGFARVHAVDATVFPSITATTITFAAMANAHRISTEVGVACADG
ncbi:MAG TPA: GMC family oxidoreductase N-terminal domain-containing protein [Chthoniobacteraceae bacterium]|jgi:choline dehydrogenase-like flavoprotein|nr:GMC family oxidoreductase N-terminal domain-containing protein [Chthoniobacteraceae bacterium]